MTIDRKFFAMFYTVIIFFDILKNVILFFVILCPTDFSVTYTYLYNISMVYCVILIIKVNKKDLFWLFFHIRCDKMWSSKGKFPGVKSKKFRDLCSWGCLISLTYVKKY